MAQAGNVVPITSDARAQVIESLMQALAEVAVTTTKAQTFHWNVTGMAFGSLHELFEDIYDDHFEAQDDLAERIKAIDGHADGRYTTYLKRSAIKEHDGHGKAEEFVEIMTKDQEQLAQTHRALATVAERAGDMLTNDLAIERARKHEKFAWMLRVHLREKA